ncbi:bifunctional protein RfaE, domain II [Helicobacter pullorum MIT 98-5489]|uniref:Bifunctional protein HldE n=1 Tax=Helicobacter pullorum MIT 98-5489 TaxID=537972 RepID=C5EYT5_9HELI|nr:bifunctional protein RfaE, domain II [Helicobacter pullorum MIT 98-5489]
MQVIEVAKETLNLGGACNVANNLVALECEVFICGMVGKDEAGTKLKETLESLHIHTQGIYYNLNRPTTQKSRIIAAHQQVIRVDREDKSPISQEGEEFILNFSKTLIESHKIDCIILSDYQKGVLSENLTQNLIKIAKDSKLKILIDPKGKDYSKYKGATLLTPNKKEAKEATGIQILDDSTLLLALQNLKKSCNLEYSLITLSEDGIGILDDKLHKLPTIAKEVFDVTGAGDTVIAALAFMLAQNEDILSSIQFANAAAAVVVGKIGSAVATKQEIFSYLQDNHLLDTLSLEFFKVFKENPNTQFLPHLQRISQKQKPIAPSSKLINQNAFSSFLEFLGTLKQQDFKIVFTNGCFDILHFGHISYLNQARALGDLLIVGLNSDNSIKRLKGKDRPINCQEDRAALLCALECVDFVIIFDEDTPLELIKAIQPHFLAKGADYQGKEVVGSEFAKKLCLIDFVEGKSTTNTIQKIKKG